MSIVVAGCTHLPQQPVKKCYSSYAADIKPIVTGKCVTAGCHDGSTQLPDFNNDSIILAKAKNIQQFVFELNIMPPANGLPLSVQEKEKLKCWLDNGAIQK